ncbi:unnamed protein product [Dibothriocephalus latus]|uniref:carbonic anhydrase n=1 Tax=Dibothriocephalus latus TaxID=60516 RepID=A0A3P7LQG1_DIBLA|nr:unnamed protein product [Dibothriocephalus latus]
MHIVSYSSMYASFAEAKSSPGGLAVIGVFFQLTTNQAESSLSKMGNLFSSLGGLSNAGSKVNVNAFKPDVLLPQNKDEFFRYQGSLTTPPCTENVQWTVMRHSLKVTNEDLVKLRSLHFGNNDGNKPMQDNFRPVKSLNTGHAPQTRVLYKSWSASGRIVPALVPVVSELTLGMLSR